MCRRNQLLGWALIALGVGILLGAKLGACFLTTCLGVGLIMFGFNVARKK